MVKASAIPGRVPLGFVCGYPLTGSGELYGGSMFARSAARDTLQGKAIHAVNERWGEKFKDWSGRESIGFPVCKKKYAPFTFKIIDAGGKINIKVERMYGCACHSNIRKSAIKQHGLRPGWEPFGQWSIRKAQERARQEIKRVEKENDINAVAAAAAVLVDSDDDDSHGSNAENTNPVVGVASNICANGKCVWKVKSAFDDVYQELTGCSESEPEDFDC